MISMVFSCKSRCVRIVYIYQNFKIFDDIHPMDLELLDRCHGLSSPPPSAHCFVLVVGALGPVATL